MILHLECDNDESLVRALGVARRSITHHAGKPRVAKALEGSRGPEVTGMVDEDPGSVAPPYLRQFKVAEDLPALRLRRHRHPTTDTWLIEIQPDLEPWLYAAAHRAGLKPQDHGLPENYKVLHNEPKTFAERLKKFVRALEEAGSQHILVLKGWLH